MKISEILPRWKKNKRFNNVTLLCTLVLYTMVGGLIGFVSYGKHSVVNVAYSVFLLLIFCLVKKRYEIFFTALAYYLVCSRAIPNGSQVFFTGEHSYMFGVALWLASSFFLTLPYFLFRFKKNDWKHNLLGLFLVFISITALPIGVIGWASPFNSAGIFFGGTGFYGFAFLMISVMLIAELFRAFNTLKEMNVYANYVAKIAVIVLICIIPTMTFTMPQEPRHIEAVSTHFGVATSARSNWIQMYQQVAWVGLRIGKSKKPYILFPETSAGAWTSKAHRCLWWVAGHTASRYQKTLILGGQIPNENDIGYKNCLIFMGADTQHQHCEMYFPQRIPVPVSMWRPWDKKHSCDASWLANGRLELPLYHSQGLYLICYEQFIPWCFLRSVSFCSRNEQPTFVLASSNLWWCNKTNLQNIQKQTVYSLAALFGLPVAYAVNM